LATWAEFERAAPEIASVGRGLLTRSGIGEALLATIRRDGLPRISPVYAEIVAGRLLTFVASTSAKAVDLAGDGRYSLHTHIDPASPDEFSTRGRATAVDDADLRRRALAAWGFDASTGYDLFELDVERALLGRRPTADDWPPVYASWSVAREG
jgi:Pyridoxamine 5'-phosphate oxidase